MTPTPCEEQGCTDTDQCDEICDHSRIYSPAWVKQHDTAIRKDERERVLDILDTDIRSYGSLNHQIGKRFLIARLESLRGKP